MRELTVDDVFAVAKIAVKAGTGIGKTREPGQTAIAFFTGLLSETDDVKAWLASVKGVSVDEFSAMPPSALLDVIEELAGREDIKDFFSRAARLSQSLMGSAT